LPSIVLSMFVPSTSHPLYCPLQPTRYRLRAYVRSTAHGNYHTDHLVLMDLAWKTGSYSRNSVLKVHGKIHYLDCSRYSLDSSVSNFNLLRSKDVPFEDDTYVLSILLICNVTDAYRGGIFILSV
jgi:hypothetical protein